MKKAMYTSKDIRAELIRMGVNKSEINTILRLRNLIIFFDDRVFSMHIPIRLISGTTNRTDVACYGPKTKKQEEHYGIFIPNIKKFMRAERRNRNIIDFLTRNSSYDDCPHPLNDEILIRVAAHEVRHRLQKHSIRKFKRMHVHSVKHPFLRKVIRWVHLLFVEDAKIYREEGKSKKFIRHKINPLEFDAKVIECCIEAVVQGKEILGKDIHLLSDRRFVKKLLSILRMEPSV